MVNTISLMMLALQIGAASQTPDVAKRRQDAQRVEMAASEATTEDLIPEIAAGFQDEDAGVRLTFANALLRYTQQRARRNGRVLDVSLGNEARVSSLVNLALRDADARVRAAAISTIPFVTRVQDVAIAEVLAARYDTEANDGVRVLLMFELAKRTGTGRTVQETVERALTDPDVRVRRQAALGIAQFRPPSALLTITAELRSGNNETQEAFVHALSSYGSAAKPHASILEALLAGEASQERRHQLTKALETIRQSR